MMLYVCCGLPRCGKSSFSNMWVNGDRKRVIVAGDDIRLALTGQRFNHCSEEMVLTIKHIMIKSLLMRGHTVLHDGTNTDLRSVHKIEKIAETLGERLTFVLFDTSEEECIHRAEVCNQPDLVPVIKNMAKNLQITQKYISQKYENQRQIAVINTSDFNQKHYFVGHRITQKTYDTIILFDGISCKEEYDTNVIRIKFNDNTIHSFK